MKRAAMYLRSSKDRKDVSLDTQRRELEKLASDRGLEITAEFADVVESGKDEMRPGYQQLCAAVANKTRGWDNILILDTSRLARRQYIAMAFSHHCQRKGVRIHYAKVPELDPINEILILSVMRAMDEIHSHSSREKGTAGMAENVRKGFRAGGRAPLGYVLEHTDTGLIREGKPVQKSTLRPGPDADAVSQYLKARAAGSTRPRALKDAGLKIAETTAVGMEWNALTYSGSTVWNVHRECGADGYGDGGKRRPRSEWIINENTHQALITREEAEHLLHKLATSDRGKAVSAARRSISHFLLSELLVAPDGVQWRGMTDRSGPSYRLAGKPGARGRVIRAAPIERFILDRLSAHMASDEMIEELHNIAQETEIDTAGRKLKHAELVGLTAKIDRAVEAALNLDDPAPIYRKIDALERERKALVAELEQLKQDEQLQRAAKSISREHLRELMEDLAEAIREKPVEETKPLLASFLDRVVLNPQDLTVQLHFRIGADCEGLASPRVCAATAVIKHVIDLGRMAA